MIWIQLYNIVLRTAKLSKTVDCRHLWLLRSCLAQSFIRSIHSPFCIFHLQQGLIQLRLSCKCDSWVIEQNVQRSQDLGKYWGNSSIRTCKEWNFADFWTMTAEVNLIRKHQNQTSTKEAQSKWTNNARLQFKQCSMAVAQLSRKILFRLYDFLTAGTLGTLGADTRGVDFHLFFM